MKILYITVAYPPYISGISNVAHDYVEAMRKAGHEVHVLAPNTVKSLLHIGNGAILLQVLWRARRYDVLHLHYPFYGSDLLTAVAAFLWRKKFVLTYHMTVRLNGWRGMYIWLHTRYLEPIIMRLAHTVLVSTLEYAQTIKLEHRHLLELPFTVDTEKYQPVPPLTLRPCTFILVANMDRPHYFKGVEVLLNAAARLVGDWRLHLVGDGELRASYEKQAALLGISDKVIFLGKAPETLPHYQAADAHVLPSINGNEAFGLVTLEAMACGIPSIVSDLPGVRTLVLPGETGWCVAAGVVEGLRQAMQAAIDDPHERRRRGREARNRVLKHYASKDLAKRLEEVYFD